MIRRLLWITPLTCAGCAGDDTEAECASPEAVDAVVADACHPGVEAGGTDGYADGSACLGRAVTEVADAPVDGAAIDELCSYAAVVQTFLDVCPESAWSAECAALAGRRYQECYAGAYAFDWAAGRYDQGCPP